MDGHTGIEHALPVARVYEDVKQLWGQSGAGYTPTLVVGYGGIWGENYWYQKTNVWEHPSDCWAFVRAVRGRARARRRRPLAPEEDFNHFEVARTANELARGRGRACRSARTASAKGWARTGRCGCSCRAG